MESIRFVIEIVLIIIFLSILLFFLVALSKSSSEESIKDRFNKILSKLNLNVIKQIYIYLKFNN
ncbi:MAG: hypothetical protein QW350_01560 [Candidatus Aenigmatarchaeota archaeon]|nr:hypothetical protein [Candidatus Aenigmarchaeota archaeon]